MVVDDPNPSGLSPFGWLRILDQAISKVKGQPTGWRMSRNRMRDIITSQQDLSVRSVGKSLE